MKHNNKQRTYKSGFTLVDLMIALAITTILAAALTQLLMISRQSFIQVSNLSDVFNNKIQIIEYLRENIHAAGAGIVYPGNMMNPPVPGSGFLYPTAIQNPPNFSGINLSNCNGPKNIFGAIPSIKGWAYIGYYMDCGSGSGPANNWRLGMPAQASPIYAVGGGTPQAMAPATEAYNYNTNLPDNSIYYFGAEFNCQGFCAYPGYNQSELLTRVNSGGDQATACVADTTYNCGGYCRIDVYQKQISPVTVTVNPVDSSKGDQLSVTFAVRSGSGNVTDCLGQPILIPGGGVSSPNAWAQNGKNTNVTTVPVLVNNRFRVSPQGALQCQASQQVGGFWQQSAWTDITPPNTIEYMRVMLGVNDGLGTVSTGRSIDPWSVCRYVLPTGSTPPYDNMSIRTVRVALVVKSTNPMLTTPSNSPVILFPAMSLVWPVAGKMPSDLYKRSAITATIMLDSLPNITYPIHCAHGNALYYVKAAGIPWINGSKATDWCYAGTNNACFAYNSLGACESGKYTAVNGAQGRFAHAP